MQPIVLLPLPWPRYGFEHYMYSAPFNAFVVSNATACVGQIVLAAGEFISFSGIAQIVYYDAGSNATYSLNGGFNTIANELSPKTIPNCKEPPATNGRTILTPGFMGAMQALSDRFGTLPWATLVEPALYFASEGFPINVGLAGAIKQMEPWLAATPEGRAIFTKADGSWYQAGDWFVQPQLADFLGNISEAGADYMYLGESREPCT